MIKQASGNETHIIEEILLDAVNWMDSSGLHMWKAGQVKWPGLSRFYKAEDFYIAYHDGVPAACMAMVDHDPVFWPDIPKGESLYLHKLAVKRAFAGKGFSKQLIDFAKETARKRGIKTVRLDCHRNRPRLRAVYEREGFVCVSEKTLFGKYETAFYVCYVDG
ncbi:MAG: GNAT family N-acetyltransferase [Clostridiaceae bacterium]|nr:GNAT family N-acetyltransferase [Clostridiaceae bacterium]